MFIFALSANAGSMELFYSHLAALRRRQETLKQTEKTFSSIYALDADLTKLQELAPVLMQKTSISRHGYMLIIGY